MSNANEIEETMQRIQSHSNVLGIVVLNAERVPIKTGFDNTKTAQYTEIVKSLADQARSAVRDLDPTNDLTFLRIRSTKQEIMIAPDKEFTLIVVQTPTNQF